MTELQRVPFKSTSQAVSNGYSKKFEDIFGQKYPAGTYVYVSGSDIVAAQVPADATPADEDMFLGVFGL